MAISVSCPGCGAILKAPDKAAGKSSKCPHCGRQVKVSTGHTSPDEQIPVIVAKPPTVQASQPTAAERFLQRHRWTIIFTGYGLLALFALAYYLYSNYKPNFLIHNPELFETPAYVLLMTGVLTTILGHIFYFTFAPPRSPKETNPKRQKIKLIAGVVFFGILGLLLLYVKAPTYFDRQDSSLSRQQWQEENAFYSTTDPGFVGYDEARRKATMNDVDRMLRSTGQGNSIPKHRR